MEKSINGVAAKVAVAKVAVAKVREEMAVPGVDQAADAVKAVSSRTKVLEVSTVELGS